MSDNTATPPEHFNFARHLTEVNANRSGKTALIDDAGSMTYGQLTENVQRMSAALSALGLRREDRVLLLMHDCSDWVVSFLGALHAGVVPVCVNTLLTTEDYGYMLANSRAQAALVSAALLPALQAAMASSANDVRHVIVSRPTETLPGHALDLAQLLTVHAPGPCAHTHGDEPAFWLYSSGSTGAPKGTVHTQTSLYWTAELYGKGVLDLRESDTVFSAAKLFFAYGLGNALSFPLSVGATVVLMAERPTPQATFKRLVEQQPTVFYGAPTGYGGMLASPDLPEKAQVALRLCSSAGEALPRDIGERWTARFGCEIIDGIGSTEMLHVFLSNRPGDVRYGTTGKAVPGYEVQLRDEDGKVIHGANQIGDLYIAGPSAALLYWNNRAKSRETFQGPWTKSGDKYTRDPDGYYTYAGRNDDMLKVSGIYVSPFEVEATLVQHPAVLEVAVIGKQDAEGLTKTKAYVVLKSGAQATEQELQAFVKEKLAPYKYPRFIEFVTELPKTATGKIQRFKLRELETQRQFGA
ncbi:4-hydroxybenzoate--CoA ligase [Hydrogenophaga crassostreae]|uniref:4-hydroxybenzoate--CoA ligase n=1 Tax=Hydrogenophaga crassostreae TaxID=1763535 RepID=A0A167ICE3_9BURK|nr:benzoate-CoA ligase family protein [Hydrogenophaga crassostreae]AOW12451.1 4-hydroxybenzoate--CoA ligase [Hydrogenophaga crassostreae]OAD42503.1 4-hydroxybenzoate--CoA ligase [Hydrogenophaga crassostreae]